MEKNFMHTVTGSIDTREGWILSYTEEELDARELSAEQAFDIDLNNAIFEEDPYTENDEVQSISNTWENDKPYMS